MSAERLDDGIYFVKFMPATADHCVVVDLRERNI